MRRIGLVPFAALVVVVVGFAFTRDAGAQTLAASYTSGDLVLPIPDGASLEHEIAVTDTGQISNVEVFVRLNHTYDSDLALALIAPDGTRVTLSGLNGGAGDDYGTGSTDCAGTPTRFGDRAPLPVLLARAPFAGSFRPEAPLAVLRGKRVSGTWRLRIRNIGEEDSGSLFCWGLRVVRYPTTAAMTAVRFLEPFFPEGRNPRVQFSRSIRGTCWTGSLTSARYDAWRCMSGNLIRDPCFEDAYGDSPRLLACPGSRLGYDRLIRLTTRRDLPYRDGNPLRNGNGFGRNPWAISLSGTGCRFSSGASFVVRRKRANYFCRDGRVLLGSPIRRGRLWSIDSVRSTRFLDTGARPIVRRVRIRVVWW